MKRLLLQTCLMVGSVLILGAAANAQISQQYRADIPFDFSAAGSTWTAGKYKVLPVGPHSSIGALAILDVKKGKMKLLGQATLGRENRDRSSKLVFVKRDGRYTLSEIVTPTFAIKMKGTETSVRVAGRQAADLETVAINLH